jgi:starvation-inducible DNA-binding protein
MKKIKINTGISDKNREALTAILNAVIADEFVLLAKTYNYHWNIHSSSFKEMHELYENQYKGIQIIIDEVAERVPQIGTTAIGSLKDFLVYTRLKEGPYHIEQSKQVRQLTDDHETIIRSLRKDIESSGKQFNDAVTADLLTKILGQHEKMAWMLRSYIVN